MVFKRIAKDSALFSIANFGSRILGMLLVPMYVQYINPEEYGQLDFLQTLSGILSMVLVCGLPSALVRFYHSVASENKPYLASTGLLSITAFSFPIALLIFIFAHPIADTFFPFQDSYLYIRVLSVSFALHLLINYLHSLLILHGASRTFVAISLSHTALSLLLNIVLIAGVKLGILGLLLSSAISYASEVVFLLLFGRRLLVFSFRKEYFGMMIRFGAPMILASISGWVLSASDRFFLVHYSSYEQVGLYSIAYKFASGLNFLFFTPFIRAWTRTIFAEQNSAGLKEVISRTARYYVSAALFFAVTASVFIPEILRILTNPEYYSAYSAFPLLIASFVAFNFNRLLEVPLHLKNKSGLSASLGMFAMCLNLVLNYLLIPKFGILGAALATYLSYTANNVAFYLCVQKFNPVAYPIAPSFIFLVGGILVVGVCLYPGFSISWPLKIPITLSYLLLLGLWNRKDLALATQRALELKEQYIARRGSRGPGA